MSDLISRSELIKALDKYCGSQRYLVSENIREIINNQPTAYSVEKVVEELEEKARTVNVIGYGTIYEAINKDVAIEIVKQGDVNDDVSDDVCEWERDEHLENDNPAEWIICPHNPKIIFSKDIKYCPYCGKEIKVVE